MLFSDVLGLPHIKNHLTTTVDNGRIPHAQLFIGPSGSGTLLMAIAYARYVLCGTDSSDAACQVKMDKLSHPDLHFAFPVATNHEVKKNPVAGNFLQQWRDFIKTQPYGNLYDWYQTIGIENKQGQIGVHEAQDIVKSLSLKSYEGGYKIMIIWGAEKMNSSCANKLLKLIEEPPEKTLFILIAQEEEQIIQTILSRCQKLHFPPLTENVIADGLVEREGCSRNEAFKIAHRAQGDFNTAQALLKKDAGDHLFQDWFINWVRSAFKAKKDKKAINDLLSWSETIAATGRESQKKFLLFCMDFFRQALLENYRAHHLVYMEPEIGNFSLEKFAPFVNNNNITGITKELEDAILHIERNGNAKVILTDLSIKLTRLLHKK